MAVYTRYAKVLDAEGKPLTVREALALINQTLDEALAEQEGDFDADSRWALAWFEQSGFAEGEYGVAERSPSPRTRASPAWSMLASSNRAAARCGCSDPSELPRRLGPGHRSAAYSLGDGPPTDPRARSRRRRRSGRACRKARQQGRDCARTCLPALHPLRTQETRGRGAVLQRARTELAGDLAPRPRGWQSQPRRRN